MSGIIYYLGESPKVEAVETYAKEFFTTSISVALELAVKKLGSMKAVAEALGIARGVLYNWMGRTAGGFQKPKRENLVKLARLINVPVEILEES
jgi:hypothetical protein